MRTTTLDNGETVEVTFRWSTEHGACYDCGLPAAYSRSEGDAGRLCSVCAALAASEGETITRLGEDD